jgi:hypothetical protein
MEEKSVFILTSDGHKDSVNLKNCAIDNEGLKKVLIQEMEEIGRFVVQETIKIIHDDKTKNGLILFKYKFYGDDELEDGTYRFFKLNIVC